jgi:hypothetical protein
MSPRPAKATAFTIQLPLSPWATIVQIGQLAIRSTKAPSGPFSFPQSGVYQGRETSTPLAKTALKQRESCIPFVYDVPGWSGGAKLCGPSQGQL